MGGEVSTDFKSSNRIEISRLVQVLLNFEWFQWSPLGGWGCGWMGVGVVRVCPHTYAHKCACMYMCAHDIIGNSQGFPKNPMEAAICLKLSCLPHVRVCMHMHMCGGHPPTTPHPQRHREPKTPKFDSVWRFFTSEHSWSHIDYSWLPQTPPTHLLHHPPTCPTPQSRGNPNQKNYNNSWTNRDNSILFEDLGPLNPPAHI